MRLEEQAWHPLAYWHGSLALSRSGHYLATVMWACSIGLALQFSRRHSVSSDSNVVTRTLLAQINYTADVAANMPSHTYTTGSDIFRCVWRARQKSVTIVLSFLPVPAGLCLRFRRNTQSVLRLVLPTSGAGPLVEDGYTVELLLTSRV